MSDTLPGRPHAELSALIRQAVCAGATDILFSPGARMGKVIVRSGAENLLSRVLPAEALERLAQEVAEEAGLSMTGRVGEEPMQSMLSSFEVVADDPIRIRVICTPTPTGSILRLRLQLRSVLGRAREQFREGLFGGREILPFLHARNGLALVVGPVSSGKTSALHHLAAEFPGGVAAVLSEAREFDSEGARPALTEVRTLEQRLAAVRVLGPGAVLIDEMDESDKLALALSVAEERLVMASVVAPNLEAALRRTQAVLLRNQLLDRPTPHVFIGVLRTGWGVGAEMRMPAYAWFPFERHPAGACPCCGEERRSGACRRCGEGRSASQLKLAPQSLLKKVDELEAYRAGQCLERPGEQGVGGPASGGGHLARSIGILESEGGDWPWPRFPGSN